jgi:hypothetical protein
MFRATSNNQYLPSKSIAVKPEVVSDVVGADQIRFHLPSFLGFIDPNQTTIKFNLKIENARGFLVPDKNCGGHALFRNISYRDGSNATELELNEDYNANYALMSNYTKQNSVAHKRELFNGTVSKLGDDITDPILYYASPAVAGGTVTAPTGLGKTALTPKLQFQLNSGIWKQGKTLPLSAMNGLRMTIDTEEVDRALMYLNDESRFSSLRLANTVNRILTAATAGGAKTATNDAAGDARGAGLGNTVFSISTAYGLRKFLPFDVDDILYIADAADGANEEKLGTIVGFFVDANNSCAVSYVPDRDTGQGLGFAHAQGSRIYIKMADRSVAHTVVGVTDINVNTKSHSILAPTYRMSNIEMVCQQISPPPAFVERLLKASGTEQGVQLDITTYELYRHNQNNVQGLQQMVIPSKMTRAKSLFSQPLAVDRFRDLGNSSFQGLADSARNYEWIYGTAHYPSRLVPLSRYSQAVPRVEALHSSELHKAILNVGEKVLSLQRIPNHFTIARALTKYGQIMNVADQTLSLRVDYDSTATTTKIFNNYVYGLRRIVINKDGVSAFN